MWCGWGFEEVGDGLAESLGWESVESRKGLRRKKVDWPSFGAVENRIVKG